MMTASLNAATAASQRAAAIPRDHRLHARCEACGHTWRLQRHEALRCPYCQNEPALVVYVGSYVELPDEASPRWMR